MDGMTDRSGIARSGDLDVFYDEFGDPGDPPVLLIMGLGAQMVYWRAGFCQQIADAGYRVIRFDNRDCGLTTKLHGARIGGPPLPVKLAHSLTGTRAPGAPYSLVDMAGDARAVLDHLEIEQAHIVGASMGGMITQIFAAEHADRTASATIIMSSNNRPFLRPPATKQIRALTTPPPKNATREQVIAHMTRLRRIIGSPVYPQDPVVSREYSAEFYDRCYYPAGFPRQVAAILGTGSLVGYNKRTTAPALVVHGTHDKLMRPTGGRAIAETIPGARLAMINGMAHDLPEPLWDDIVGEMTAHFSGARFRTRR